ncbi:hydrogenase accessory protein HypB [Methylibium sp. Pch-M]|nr:hydrogenase accessory protein HypB [Methylibium sp. Pch-M]
MCVICGCGGEGQARVSMPGEIAGQVHTHADGTTHAHGAHGADHDHDHDHDHAHGHPHGHDHVHGQDPHPDHAHTPTALQVPGRDTQTIALEAAVLGKNQALAERNRGWLAGRRVLALNLMSSPGAGKTTLLERCIRDLQGQVGIAVVEGDQATENDAERIRATGVAAVQVNTGTGCHLEADMLQRALQRLQPAPGSLLMIENVGNLVCPALFDLGEHARVVIFSVTEGEDKPLKYPHMFKAADVLLLSKTDLLPHLRVDLQRMIDNARVVNPGLAIFPVSAYSGEGLDAWYGWLRGELAGLGAAA